MGYILIKPIDKDRWQCLLYGREVFRGKFGEAVEVALDLACQLAENQGGVEDDRETGKGYVRRDVKKS